MKAKQVSRLERLEQAKQSSEILLFWQRLDQPGHYTMRALGSELASADLCTEDDIGEAKAAGQRVIVVRYGEAQEPPA